MIKLRRLRWAWHIACKVEKKKKKKKKNACSVLVGKPERKNY
jgi:hypothetical protein